MTLGASRRKEKEQDLLEASREGATHMPWTPRLLETSISILWSLSREVFPPRWLGRDPS